MKVLIIGYGSIGEVLTKLLAKQKEISKILCIDYVEKSVIKNRKVSFQKFNVSDKSAFLDLLKENKFDLVVNTAVPKFNLLIMDACISAKTNYMDLASQWEPSPDKKPWSPPSIKTKTKSPYKVEEFDYQEQFEKSKLKGLIVAGVSPGLTNLFVREAVDFLDETDYIKIRLVDYSGTKELYFAWSKEGLLDEIGCNPLVYKKGKFVTKKPFSGEEIYDYPRPFGKKEVSLICQDEIGTLPFFIKAKQIDIKDYDNLVGYHKELYETGKLSRKKIIVNGKETTQFDLTVKSLPDVPASLAEKKYEKAQFAFAIEAIGRKNKKKAAIQYLIMFPTQGEINKFGLNANFISYPTALSASLFVRAIPKIKQAGVFPPELLEKNVRGFIAKELPKNHVKVYRRIYMPK